MSSYIQSYMYIYYIFWLVKKHNHFLRNGKANGEKWSRSTVCLVAVYTAITYIIVNNIFSVDSTNHFPSHFLVYFLSLLKWNEIFFSRFYVVEQQEWQKHQQISYYEKHRLLIAFSCVMSPHYLCSSSYNPFFSSYRAFPLYGRRKQPVYELLEHGCIKKEYVLQYYYIKMPTYLSCRHGHVSWFHIKLLHGMVVNIRDRKKFVCIFEVAVNLFENCSSQMSLAFPLFFELFLLRKR